ncbi:MAG: hypothetical protein ACOC4M_10055 [Promethearchaeia archaeon]
MKTCIKCEKEFEPSEDFDSNVCPECFAKINNKVDQEFDKSKIINILIKGKRKGETIDFTKNLKKELGEDWAKKWIITSVNLLDYNENIIRVSLEKKGEADERK